MQEETHSSDHTDIIDPKSFIPRVNPQVELAFLDASAGQTNKNEVQRSDFYRTERQLPYLRNQIESVGPESAFHILNVGPANLEEAITYGVAAEAQGKLNQTKITLVDVQPKQAIRPRYSLGTNVFYGTPIAPPENDKAGYILQNGEWVVNPQVQEFVKTTLESPDNKFETPIEEYLLSKSAEKYDVVTFNNVMQYLGTGSVNYDNPLYKEEGDFRAFQCVLLGLAEQVKEGGLLFIQLTKGGKTKETANQNRVNEFLQKETNFSQVFQIVDGPQGVFKRVSGHKLGFLKS